jgi:HK97 family phage portal protein
MSMGTQNRNVFHRLGDAWQAFKAAPEPGLFYPPGPNRGQSTGWINWRGWPEFEAQAQDEGRRDMIRARTAVTSPWVYSDVRAIAAEFSTSTLIVKERRGDKLEDVENHPLERLWESPNEDLGRSFVMEWWAWSYVLVGQAYLYWVPDTAGSLDKGEVWPVPPWMIRPIPDKDNFIKGYAFRSSDHSPMTIIPPEMITYSHSVNLWDIRDGLSFLVAADTEIKADLAASMWNLNFFSENNGVPDGMIGLDPNALDQDVERVRMELRDFFGGTKRGLAVARSNDLKYTQFGRTQKDMEFGAGREFASKVIGRTLGFPDGYWSDLANRANAEQARRTMISGAVWPLLVRLAEDMNAARRGVVQRWYGENFRVEFKDIRPEDKESKRAELVSVQPFYTLNELRELTGQEAFEPDDPRGLMLVAEIAAGTPLPGTPAAIMLEELQAEKDEAAAQEAAAAAEEAGGLEEELPDDAMLEDEPLPDDIAPEDEALMEEEAPIEDEFKALADLRAWETKALHDMKRKGRVYRTFESDVIDADEHARISAALADADSVEAVKAAFKRDAVDTLLDDVDADARAWAGEASE